MLAYYESAVQGKGAWGVGSLSGHRLIVAGTGTPFPIPFPLHIKMVYLQCLNYSNY